MKPYALSTVSAEKSPQREESRAVKISKPVKDRVSLIQQITTPKPARVSVYVWTSIHLISSATNVDIYKP